MKESNMSFILSFSKDETNKDIRLPPEIVHEIIDYAQVDSLLTLRQVNKEFKSFIDDDFAPETWKERTSKLSSEKFGIDRIRVKNRLVLACLKEPRCCLCGRTYSAKGKGTDAYFGVYAHERCRNKRIFRCDKIATMLRTHVPSDKLIEIYATDIIKLSGCTGSRAGYNTRPGHRPWEYDRENIHHATAWLMPHWSTRDSLYHCSLAHSKNQELGNIMAGTIVNALDEYAKCERKKRQERKDRDDLEKSQVMSRLDNFSAKIGGEMYHHIFYLSSLLQRISKTRRPSYYQGHRYNLEDEKTLQKITNDFSRQTDFVHKGINSIHNKDTDTWQDAGAALPISNWVAMVASAYTAISKVNFHPGTTHNVFHREFKRRKTAL